MVSHDPTLWQVNCFGICTVLYLPSVQFARLPDQFIECKMTLEYYMEKTKALLLDNPFVQLSSP